jgi:S-adenosyl-L-methionine hydrolase (adenosine-forming)
MNAASEPGQGAEPPTSHLSAPLITLTTDFGLEDNFVGVMKGVIVGIAPAARVVDLTHGVPPQDVATGAFSLATAFDMFPPGTIHLAIVDPGVGSERRAMALAAGGYVWVAPDNGLLGYALAALAEAGRLGGGWDEGWWHLGPDAQAVELTEPRYWRQPVSRTFHGRDVFAPVAAHLANGVPLAALGRPLDRVQALALSRPEPTADGWRGAVIAVDRFGNLLSNLAIRELGGEDWEVEIAGQQIEALSPSYAAMRDLGAILGSAGYLEVAVRNGNAASQLGAAVGTPLSVRRCSPG